MKKGFTLIELLAVILILGIIALIAIPQVTNVIEDSKKGAVEVSGDNYIKTLQDKISLEKLKDGTVLEGVKTVQEINTAYPNLVSGDAPTTGTVTITKGKVTEATFESSKYTTLCTNGKCKVVNFVYFQSVGEFTSLDQAVTTRPTTYKAYLRIDKNDITKVQACSYDNGKEFCLNNNDYEAAKQKILNYFGYDSSWEHVTENGENLYLKVIEEAVEVTCAISDLQVSCGDSSVQLNASKQNDVFTIDISEMFGCAVGVTGAACEDF